MNIKACTTDKFRKTYRSLKKQEQELVDKGVDLWLENPDNGSSNFEKLGFMGDNIFSIRLNSAWRVIMAKFDDVFFLLHVF
jgi:plasmid maintenance system killer protein